MPATDSWNAKMKAYPFHATKLEIPTTFPTNGDFKFSMHFAEFSRKTYKLVG